MKHKPVVFLSIFLMLSVYATAQTPVVKNFDAELNYDRADVVIQPPPGKVWTLLRASFQIQATSTRMVTIYEQEGTAGGLCTNLIRAQLDNLNRWVPIVGGYVAHPRWGNLRGLDAPIVLPYPNRLVIHLHDLQETVQTWTRVTLVETDQ